MSLPQQKLGTKEVKVIVRQFLLYGLIGGCSALLDLLVFILLCTTLTLNEYLSNIVSIHAGMAMSFLFNRKFNFKKTDKVPFRAGSFYLVGLFGLLLSEGLLWLGQTIGFKVIPIKIASVFIVGIIQFTLNRLISFGR